MSLEEVESCCGRPVSVIEHGKLVAQGLLERADVVSIPEPLNNGEGWRVAQVLVLIVDARSYRVRFGANVTVQS